jgi:hypothetical protein
VISAYRDVQSVQVRFQRRMNMILFNFRNNCKHNIRDWLMIKIFQELFANQKGLLLGFSLTTTLISVLSM